MSRVTDLTADMLSEFERLSDDGEYAIVIVVSEEGGGAGAQAHTFDDGAQATEAFCRAFIGIARTSGRRFTITDDITGQTISSSDLFPNEEGDRETTVEQTKDRP